MFDTLMRVTIGLGTSMWLVALAVPNFSTGCRRRSSPRQCFMNQKTIAGAVEMYNLDYNTNVTGLSPRFAESLVRLGYIQDYPTDPHPEGQQPGQYVMVNLSGNGIACTRHGGIQSPDGGPWKRADFDRLNAELTGLSLEEIQAMEAALEKQEQKKYPPREELSLGHPKGFF